MKNITNKESDLCNIQSNYLLGVKPFTPILTMLKGEQGAPVHSFSQSFCCGKNTAVYLNRNKFLQHLKFPVIINNKA